MESQTPELPPYIYGREAGENEKVWPESAVRTAIAAAVQKEREACAVLMEQRASALIAAKRTNQIDRHTSDVLFMSAAAIRARADGGEGA